MVGERKNPAALLYLPLCCCSTASARTGQLSEAGWMRL